MKIIKPYPFVKWAGGKRQLLTVLKLFVPENYDTYIEPFLGGGALFFSLMPQKAIVSDINQELINAYIVIRDKVYDLIESLKRHKNDMEYFYEIRRLDTKTLSDVERASRFIYLNKT
ncbi:MAG: DNA adenine methylase, partial [Candidatus Aenigmatarchaeota archaeon]